DVDAAESVDRGRDQGIGAGFPRQIADRGAHAYAAVAAERRGVGIEMVAGLVADHEVGTVLGEPPRQLDAEAGVGAGDDGDATAVPALGHAASRSMSPAVPKRGSGSAPQRSKSCGAALMIRAGRAPVSGNSSMPKLYSQVSPSGSRK